MTVPTGELHLADAVRVRVVRTSLLGRRVLLEYEAFDEQPRRKWLHVGDSLHLHLTLKLRP